MIEIRPVNYCYEDKEYDNCGNTSISILEVNGIKIPLCEKCVKELTESLEEFNTTIFCHKCENFIMSEYGFRYGGSCKRLAELNGKKITEKDAGYLFCVNCMDTCKYAILKQE